MITSENLVWPFGNSLHHAATIDDESRERNSRRVPEGNRVPISQTEVAASRADARLGGGYTAGLQRAARVSRRRGAGAGGVRAAFRALSELSGGGFDQDQVRRGQPPHLRSH